MSDEYWGDECEHEWGEPEDLGHDVWRVTCKRCGEEAEEVLIMEYWKNKTMTVTRKTYPALKGWGNIVKCSECGKIVFDIPLILWNSKDTSKALTFHFECAERLGILDQLKAGVVSARD